MESGGGEMDRGGRDKKRDLVKVKARTRLVASL